MASLKYLLSTVLLISILCFNPFLVSSTNKVPVYIYYESLCPYCSDFIANKLGGVFQNGLISIADVKFVPFGNAVVTSGGSVICQHGEGECMLNAIEACAIKVSPNVQQHFPFIQCVEKSVDNNNANGWQSCFQSTGMSSDSVVNCYNSGYGQQLEVQYGKQTPTHEYVPWVVVDGKPLYEDYENLAHYICKAYNGALPKSCKGQRLTVAEETRSNGGERKVCFPGKTLT